MEPGWEHAEVPSRHLTDLSVTHKKAVLIVGLSGTFSVEKEPAYSKTSVHRGHLQFAFLHHASPCAQEQPGECPAWRKRPKVMIAQADLPAGQGQEDRFPGSCKGTLTSEG